jgi:hypothetical protein
MRIVNSLDELLRLPADARVNGYRVREPLRLEIPALARVALASAQDALNRLQERCGCIAGAGAMFATLLVGVAKVFQRNPSLLTWRAFSEFFAVLVVSFALGSVAKLAALAVTRWQFAYRCRVQHYLLSMQLPRTAN